MNIIYMNLWKPVILLGLIFCLFTLGSANAQVHPHSEAFLKISEDYREGEISLETAIIEPFRLAFNPNLSSYAHLIETEGNGILDKCFTPSIIAFEKNKSTLSEATRTEIEGYLENNSQKMKQATETYISASGKFRFTYETDGNDAVPLEDLNSNGVPDYVENAAEAADSSYRYQIINLGFTDPIPNGALYNISFQNIGFYGFTQRTTAEASGTLIVVHNNFIGFPINTDPEGNEVGALKVTIAHEFKHAIQFAQNNWTGNTDAWAEMDATLLEEVVYDNVNDYYNYIEGSGSQFISPQQTLIPGSYEDITFALYFHEKYGDSFWPNAWQSIEAAPLAVTMLGAIEIELIANGDNFKTEVTENYLWHFASGPFNTTTNFGFKEAEFYPNPNIIANFTALPDSLNPSRTLNRMAANYYTADLFVEAEGNATVLLSTESEDITAGIIAFFPNGSSSILISANSSKGLQRIITPWAWEDIDKLGIAVVNTNQNSSSSFRIGVSSDLPQELVLQQNFPNPFNPSTTIPIEIPQDQNISLKVYDITGRLVQILIDGNVQTGFYQIPFDGSGLASGVYIYQLTTERGSRVKKMTLIK